MEIDDKEIEKLADLARIKITNEEKKELKKDIESILSYVSEIQKISSDMPDNRFNNSELVNVMREDGQPHKSGFYSEKILGEAPQREKDYMKVKKIL
ncbi:MAG: Asp-tRNA(Asn)/Glu-tRNA(Gln) amidotransferase subunit GatC [Candidatus Pacebacteria bacterium]|jgi:aspartyl-tRNA(Asn)/glutamyl-tRNA(Gln) amidotransferase subunit C|nr:Asp-tRNA(Asn)/Glu-tRNA(Gln) amidotransferase subunit GatC [Candidatus Paceibacterota bacterium]|tara:strand:+ start:41639 stop:41929 length:291 start_codon:yes stop_codon:yes gene_type:complete